MAPSYLARDLRRLSDMPSRRRLRSSLTHQLDVRQSQCATVGDRAFATAGARSWNSLPADIVACDTLPQFRRELKTFLFRQSIRLYCFSFCARQHNVIARICPSVCLCVRLSVRPSVTRVDQSKKLEIRFMQLTPPGSRMTLVSSRLTSPRNSKGNIGSEGAK